MTAAASAVMPSLRPLDAVLTEIAGRAAALDAQPRFPAENFDALLGAGIPQRAADRARSTLEHDVAVIRAVAGADASTARILDGHLNGTERVALAAAGELRERELEAVGRGAVLIGVWGADPIAGEGPPARIARGADGRLVVRGVKTFCSGAGGVTRALVVARDDGGARRLAYVDARQDLRIDRGWYRASGLRASESHRVEFVETPVLAILGGDDELLREPFFSRDSVRSAATWAGSSDAIMAATVAALGASEPADVALHALGRMRVASETIDRWLEHATASLRDAGRPATADPQALARAARVAIAAAARTIAETAAAIGGSRALVGGGPLDRARRDLDLFLLQHRLDPALVALGRSALTGVPR
jgi:alkylation response protein AidB-like acyl-CoA dehydrogenase